MNWQTSSFAVLALVLIAGFAWYERRRPPARIVALVAALAALAVVGRLAFAAFPNVKPTTDIVLFAGFALGAVPGFVVGAVTALTSNVFFGQGPWTAWQMVAWGGVGVGGALLARSLRGRAPGRWPLAIACGVAGLAFGAFMDVYQWTLAAQQDLASYAAISATSLPFNLAHALGNVVFCLLVGPLFLKALGRYRRRFEVRWARPAAPRATGPAAASVMVGVVLAAGLTVAPTEPVAARPASAAGPSAEQARVSSPAGRALRYLRRAQNRDGGFGGDRAQSSNQLFSGWAALGAAAAGTNPRDLARRRGRSLTHYLRRAGSIRDTGELERTILVLRSAGISPRRFGRRDLAAELRRRRGRDGSWRDNVAHTAFGLMALRAAGESARSARIRRSATWLERARNEDGGYGFVPSAQSDVDDTGAALQALAAAGRRRGAAARGAVAYLRRMQRPDGGFGQSRGGDSNAQSTAWAVQGLVAAGVRPERVGANPLRYLAGLQRRDGHIAYSRRSDQTPVWVTAQALTALRRKPFPLAPVPRERRRRARGSVAGSARAGSASGGAGAPGADGARRGGGGGAASAAGEPGSGARARGARRSRDPAARSAPAASLLAPDAAREIRAARARPERASARATDPPAASPGGAPAWVWPVAAAAVLVLLWMLRRRLAPGALRLLHRHNRAS
jgi:energy-coupling factor transport system substrate-specific component